MKFFTTEQVLAYAKKTCGDCNGLYEYLDMALNELSVRQVCDKYNITRLELQWGKFYLGRLAEHMKADCVGVGYDTGLINGCDAVSPFYSIDDRLYDSGTPITADEIREALPSGYPVSIEVVTDILLTAITPLGLCDKYGYTYKAAWYVYNNVHNWGKYDLVGTYQNVAKSTPVIILDEVKILNWVMKKGFPMDVISVVKDVFNNDGYVHPYQMPALEEIREVMYKEHILYRSSNNKGKIHWGDRWKPFYIELDRGKTV